MISSKLSGFFLAEWIKAPDKFLHHWKEGHLYLSRKLISSHSELYRIGKSFWKICSEMRFYDNEIPAIFKNFPGIQNNRYNPVICQYLLRTYINLKIPKFFLRFWGSNFLYPYLSLLFWSFYGSNHSLQFLIISGKEKKFQQIHWLTGRNMRIGIFSIMCHLSLGNRRKSLLRRL